jgi:hypothetical protein
MIKSATLRLTERRAIAGRPFERPSRFCPVDAMPYLRLVLVGAFVTFLIFIRRRRFGWRDLAELADHGVARISE